MSSSPNRVLTVQQAADRLQVDVETVRRWCRNKDVVAFLTPGGRGQWRIEADANGRPLRR